MAIRMRRTTSERVNLRWFERPDRRAVLWQVKAANRLMAVVPNIAAQGIPFVEYAETPWFRADDVDVSGSVTEFSDIHDAHVCFVDFRSAKLSAVEFMQKRWPVGFGPSSNT